MCPSSQFMLERLSEDFYLFMGFLWVFLVLLSAKQSFVVRTAFFLGFKLWLLLPLLSFYWTGPLCFLPIIIGAGRGTDGRVTLFVNCQHNSDTFEHILQLINDRGFCVLKLADDRMALVSGISLDPEAAIGVTKKLPPKWIEGVDEVK